ncbi:na-ca exchanger integrin-beta4 : Uncharacterized protein OS=Fluviicola taffensis (strain DSM 16823 / RW262 / RW262) GN=Fluta_1716 PE=4 SV=1: Calx-beta: Calx-beta: Calx-beta [Gemmataceae bacterium]|nr:na-ca exchanger integrin-beta4 : Uncharacterized protein OS=Fluviicola taffensis (strain DSM 16823 / RW262 / RW262) GN=Fluta_1716 PE=4 SV=1: Calx-beta: Calx-beta: Calx-beta [Gemmataceae bacterium]VTT97193.1 na-ca exchanger integrin-beta4 : Uncharacterized protein OS=Fluviicola taffensis (strain DSM 16823 / RW262 / RW262) GN=Fluta_1716 PE=4 SV=1: Calx-beta: Calx-beta: Calx-beta [Gemmataceae bacterium]
MFRPLVPRWLAALFAPPSDRRSRRRVGTAPGPFRPQVEPLGDRVVPAAGLVLSEVLTNPSGNDSPLEYVELVATRDINFAVTPYTVVFADTTSSPGPAGWANGGVRSYAFAITSGTVARGSVVYVGGSGMAPTGIKLRTLNTATTGGDGFGVPQVPGVLGNGGGEADGVAVFDVPVGAVTPSSVPVDALLFGSAVGTAVSANYKLPVNDRYTGGTANAGSFVAPNPGTGQLLTATGVLNPVSGTWATGRSWSLGTTTTSGTSTVALLPVVTVEKIADATEGGTAGTFRFTRTGSTTAALTVNVSASGTATAGTDYTAPTTVTFGVGNATVDYTVTATNDSTSEPTETVAFAVAAGTGYVAGSPAAATMDLYDNDAQVVALEAATDTGEGTNPGKFQFTRIGNLSGSLTANYTVSGTATSETDYTALSGTVTFAAGADRAEVLVEAFGDNTTDDGETVIITLGTGTGYTVDSLATTATVTIADQALTVSVMQLADATEGVSDGTFRFTRAGDLTAALAVDYTVSGTATAGTDYTALSGTVTFGIGQHTVDVSVALLNDTTAEPTETVTVTLDPSDDYQLGNDSDTLFVKDNDTTKYIWISTSSTDWNLASNWSTGSVPTSSSDVYFDGPLTVDCINVGYGLSTLAGLHLVNGYTGTATLANALSVGTFEESSGTLNQPVSGRDLTVTGVMLWTGGTLNATDSGTAVNVSGAVGRIDPPDLGSMATASTMNVLNSANLTLLPGTIELLGANRVQINAEVKAPVRKNTTLRFTVTNPTLPITRFDVGSGGQFSLLKTDPKFTGVCDLGGPLAVTGGEVIIGDGVTLLLSGAIGPAGPSLLIQSGQMELYTGSGIEANAGSHLTGGSLMTFVVSTNRTAWLKGNVLIDGATIDLTNLQRPNFLQNCTIEIDGDTSWKSGEYYPEIHGLSSMHLSCIGQLSITDNVQFFPDVRQEPPNAIASVIAVAAKGKKSQIVGDAPDIITNPTTGQPDTTHEIIASSDADGLVRKWSIKLTE